MHQDNLFVSYIAGPLAILGTFVGAMPTVVAVCASAAACAWYLRQLYMSFRKDK